VITLLSSANIDTQENNCMDLKEYFDSTPGRGVLATAGGDGTVDAALYSTPHVLEDGTVAFIMRERLTHKNVQENPQAAFLFIEEGPGFGGVRLFLRKIKEETDSATISGLRRKELTPEEDRAKGPSFLITFAVEKVLPLVGSDPARIPLC
jgi:hypothetical protein